MVFGVIIEGRREGYVIMAKLVAFPPPPPAHVYLSGLFQCVVLLPAFRVRTSGGNGANLVFGAITRGRGEKYHSISKRKRKKRKSGTKIARKRISGVIAK